MRVTALAAFVCLAAGCHHDSATPTPIPSSTATDPASSSSPPSSAFDDVPPIPSDAPAPSVQVDAGTVTYVSYTNDRFHFTIDIPAFFDKSPAQANGAGQSFTWKGKASMRVWGAPNPQSWDTKQYFEDFARRPGILDKEQKGDSFFVTGKDRGRFFYTKGVVSRSSLVAVMIDYDDAVKDTMDAAARHVGDSLKVAPK